MAVRGPGGAGFRVDDSDLVRAAAGLRRTHPEIAKSLRRGMREAGSEVRDDIRSAAARTGSRRIPRSVKVATRVSASSVQVTVKADTRVAPHARVMEGGPGGRPARHPVFAKGPRSGWTWVAQRPRSYFYGTARARADEVRRKVFDLVSDAVRQSVRGRQ